MMNTSQLKCYIKIHQQGTAQTIGVCDEDCMGRLVKKGKYRFHVSEQFFKGELVSLQQALKILKNSNNFNAVGKNLIHNLIAEQIIHSEAVLEIEDLPIAINIMF